MIILHLNSKSSEEEKTQFDNHIIHGKDIFVLFYLKGCGPCNATRPEWKKIGNVLSNKYKNNNNIILADVDQSIMNDLNSIKMIQPKGFPSIHHVSKKGKTVKDYEDDNLNLKDRSVDSFVEWIETKMKKPSNKIVVQNGGKWSLKYKRSINCRRPKGFSQKQYCKYGRTKKRNITKRKSKQRYTDLKEI
jgi:thiol-disulfide isomerase/thioredoxin